MPAITTRQIRGARGMLGWSMTDLAKAAGVSVSTVKRAEETLFEHVTESTVGEIRSALEAAGMRFLDNDGDGEGLRLGSRQN